MTTRICSFNHSIWQNTYDRCIYVINWKFYPIRISYSCYEFKSTILRFKCSQIESQHRKFLYPLPHGRPVETVFFFEVPDNISSCCAEKNCPYLQNGGHTFPRYVRVNLRMVLKNGKISTASDCTRVYLLNAISSVFNIQTKNVPSFT